MSKKHKQTQTKDVSPGELLDLKPLEVDCKTMPFDVAFRRFKTMVQKEKVLSTYKQRSAYEKPSEKRRRKRQEMMSKLFEQTDKAKKPKDKKMKKDEEDQD